MTTKKPAVDIELSDYKHEIKTWVESIKSKKYRLDYESVVNRFLRDCETLVSDMHQATKPETADLCDFTDRKNSLEIQYLKLLNEIE